ncbi:hypothetical protein [Sphingopyxis sp.]|uniref:hypothetical protein n=1 Tax=Sphingopyxis sp. TaxID=1908224 RepID=UPI003D143F2D
MRLSPIAAALIATTPIAVACPAAAQDEGDAPIVVTGQKDIEQQIQNFVGALTPASPRGQIARFEDSICPGAVGFTKEQREVVEDRIKLVVEHAGMKAGGAKCQINMLIIATPDKPGFLKGLSGDYGFLFGDRSPGEIRRILAQPGSATAWQVKGRLNADGHPINLEQGIAVNRTTRLPSLITAAARPYVAGAVVVLDSRALGGLTTTQVADYALMRAFADVDVRKLDAASAPTILRALDARDNEEIPVTLTQWDLAFLKGLYSGPDNLYAPSQRSAIGRTIEKEIGADAVKEERQPDRSRG